VKRLYDRFISGESPALIWLIYGLAVGGIAAMAAIRVWLVGW